TLSLPISRSFPGRSILFLFPCFPFFNPTLPPSAFAPAGLFCLPLSPRPAAPAANRFCRPPPAVSHRHNVDLRIGRSIAQPLGDVFRDIARVKRAFEFIRGDENFHW